MKIYKIILSAIFIIGFSSCYFLSETSQQDQDEFQRLKKIYSSYPVITKFDSLRKFIYEIGDISEKFSESIDKDTLFVCQPLINEKGEIEEIFINCKVNKYADSLLIEFVKSLRFNTFEEVTKKSKKYSLLLLFPFYSGKLYVSHFESNYKNDIIYKYDQIDVLPIPIIDIDLLGSSNYLTTCYQDSGNIIFDVVINSGGYLERLEVFKSTNDKLLPIAIRHLWSVYYMPSKLNGEPVKAKMMIPYKFSPK